MITHRVIINAKARSYRLRPVGDFQLGGWGFREDLLRRWEKEANFDEHTLIIGMGDYSDAFRPTIQKRLKSALIDDPMAHDELDFMLMEQMQSIARRLEPLKHKIIGLLEGHHNFKLNKSGMTTTQYLCQLLNVKYLSFFSAIQLIFRFSNKDSVAIDIVATHGDGGAKYLNSDIVKLERNIMPDWDCDIFLRGHSTKVFAAFGTPLTKISQNRDSTKPPHTYERKRLLVNTGGFMEGYVEGKTSYVEEKGLPKAQLGYAVVDLVFPPPNTESRRRSHLEMSPRIIAG